MSSLHEHPTPEQNESFSRFTEAPDNFKRKLVHNSLCPRRYIVSLMLFLVLIIQTWRSINIAFTLADIIILEEEAQFKYSSIGHWTISELNSYALWHLIADAVSQIPGALLIFIFSSHKYILISVSATSILHMLTPLALSHHSASLLILLISQGILEAPIYTAVMTIWRDWAPPAERTKLMVFSLYGLFVGAAASTFYPFLFQFVTTSASYYLSGGAGLIWALFWFNITSDTPQNDPLISQEELLYLEGNIPSDFQQKIKIKDIPWKSIIKSKQVLILNLIFFKMACSIHILVLGGTLFTFHLSNEYNPLDFFVPFLLGFGIIIPCTATLADYLLKKFRGRSLLIRKIFLCGGFSLQCFCLIGTLAQDELIKMIFYMISCIYFAMSLSGFITIALDLSPRYVSIICGILFTASTCGHIGTSEFAENTISLLHLDTFSWLFLFDGLFSLLSAVLFGIWGDNEEQLWSLTFPSGPRTNDYQSYPKPDDDDDLNLVTENV